MPQPLGEPSCHTRVAAARCLPSCQRDDAAVRLNPFDHPVDFNELRLPDLVSFFTYISEELSRLRAMGGAELDKEGLRVAVAVAGRILSGLRHRNPFVPLDAIFDELDPVDRERALRAVAPCITNVVRLEKQRDFGGV